MVSWRPCGTCRRRLLIKIMRIIQVDLYAMVEALVNNWALNREGLARSRLSVGEYGSIIALHAAVRNWLGYVVEDGGLVDLFIAYEIEYELFGVESSLQVDRALIHLNALALALLRMLFLLTQRAHSNAHLDVVLLVLLVIE